MELDLSPRRVDLVAERFDVAIRVAEKLPDDSTLVARKLSDMAIHLYASPAYLKRFGTPDHPDDLARHTCLPLISSSGEAVPWMLRRGDDTWEGIPRGIVASNSPGLQRDLVINGMGIAALADPFTRIPISEGLMKCVLPEWQLPKVTLWSVTPGRKLLPSKTKAWISLLQDRLNGFTA
jgi:DNA-binding transcriptional LysR family regulator